LVFLFCEDVHDLLHGVLLRLLFFRRLLSLGSVSRATEQILECTGDRRWAAISEYGKNSPRIHCSGHMDFARDRRAKPQEAAWAWRFGRSIREGRKCGSPNRLYSEIQSSLQRGTDGISLEASLLELRSFHRTDRARLLHGTLYNTE
jgi:hypothetical protein